MSTALVLLKDQQLWNWLIAVEFHFRRFYRPLPAPQGRYSCLEYRRDRRDEVYRRFYAVE